MDPSGISKQSMDNHDVHAHHEKIQGKNPQNFQNFHLIAHGEHQKSTPSNKISLAKDNIQSSSDLKL